MITLLRDYFRWCKDSFVMAFKVRTKDDLQNLFPNMIMNWAFIRYKPEEGEKWK